MTKEPLPPEDIELKILTAVAFAVLIVCLTLSICSHYGVLS